ncbi:MAG TPA: serine/threonine-protein kinase [Kofleriaceae bacterium]
MDRTNRDGKSSEPGLDETLPSGEHPGLPSGEHAGLEETLASGNHGPSPLRSGNQPSALTRSTGGPRASLPHIERGTAIGRYTVVDRIGSGTMGLVLAAFDPTLDRKVAIKIVQLDHTGTTSGRQRLLREAQAMAKLQHPNVVTVFEVGTFEDRVFLAMEYVAGATLHDWLAEAGRTRREIITAFVAAGHGLAAAHRAGIVHRDFKPANVLVGTDGRVRVADFGLATAPTDAPPPPVEVLRDSDPGPLGMTKTGAVLGTPAYMAPEQHRGEHAEARADQFAFCVALYEALYKELPFEGGAFLVYQDNVLAGRVREAPRGSDVSARIRRVLLRGLAQLPRDRYPDMEALLAELSHDPAANRRRIALFGAAVLAAGGVAFAIARNTGDDDPCAAADQPVANIWTAADKRALEASFKASGSPGAATAFAHVSRRLDDRVTALRAARREACVATSVRREQSAELLDRRIRCVDERAAATTALITVLTEQRDIDVLMKGIDAVMSLPSIEACADTAALLAAVPPPPEPQRAQVEALSRRVDVAEALVNAGVYAKPLDELTALARESDPLGYAPLSARVHSVIADIYLQLERNEDAVAELRRTGEFAAAAHDDELAAITWTSLFGALSARQGKHDEARGVETIAAAAVVRAGSAPRLVGGLEYSRGLAALWRDEYEPAARHLEAAAKQFEQAGRSQQSRLANALNTAGTALTWASKFDEARPLLEKSLAIRVEVLGAEHPNVAFSHHGLGILFDSIGKPEQALEHFQKAAAINAKAYPPDNAHIAKSLVSVGLVLGELERVDEALEMQKRALAIFEKHPEDNRKYISTVLYNLGLAQMSARQFKEALATLERGLGIAEAEHGAESLQAASVLGGLMAASDLAGDHVKAREYGLRSLAIREKKGGRDSDDVGRTLGDLAQNANHRGKPQEAMQLIDRALAILEKPGAPETPVRFEMRKIRAVAELALRRADAALADAKIARDGFAAAKMPTSAADARLFVADALWMQGGARQRREAIAEAKAALEEVQATPKPDTELVARVRAWLDKHKL